MIRYRATPASRQVYGLGEGPVWDAPRERVLWVDINAGRVHTGALVGDQIVAGQRLSLSGTARTVGAVVCSASGELLVAGSHDLSIVAVDGSISAGPAVLPPDQPSRLNDGACDPAGRFLVGSLDLSGHRRNAELLVRLEAAGAVTVIDDDLTLSNGLAWSPDGGAFYSIDTVPGVLWVRSYDPVTGHCGPREELLRWLDDSPDGMCVDSAGNLWIALWGAGEVRCYTPNGQHIATVEVAAPNVTSVAFVGPDLDILLITTAAEQMTAARLAQYPDAGRLFTCRVGATGSPLAPWNGSR